MNKKAFVIKMNAIAQNSAMPDTRVKTSTPVSIPKGMMKNQVKTNLKKVGKTALKVAKAVVNFVPNQIEKEQRFKQARDEQFQEEAEAITNKRLYKGKK